MTGDLLPMNSPDEVNAVGVAFRRMRCLDAAQLKVYHSLTRISFPKNPAQLWRITCKNRQAAHLGDDHHDGVSEFCANS